MDEGGFIIEPLKARPDYEPLFSILDGMRHDADRHFG
jgi:hypothetical protein